MGQVKASATRCALLGDVVGSRRAADRRALHRRLEGVLADVDAQVPALTALHVTVGDEFQGSYATLGAAIDAALRLRLLLLPDVETRVGLGRGAITTLDADRRLEDGPAWWSAREAIEEVAQAARRPATRLLRTAYRVAAEEDAVTVPDAVHPAAVNAALLCRDHLVGSLSDRSVRLLRGLMEPETTQVELAAREGISASAVSQRVRVDGIGAVLAAQEMLRGLP
jgi:hypothetical protein